MIRTFVPLAFAAGIWNGSVLAQEPNSPESPRYEIRRHIRRAAGDHTVKTTGDTRLTSPDKRKTVTFREGEASLVEVGSGKPIGPKLENPRACKTSGGRVAYRHAFSPDGRLVAAVGTIENQGGGDGDAVFAVWEVATGKRLIGLEEGRGGWVHALWWDDDNRTLHVDCDDFSGK